MPNEIYSHKLQAKNKTYFFDIKETGGGNKYLQISENRMDKEGEWLRNEITVFSDQLAEFIKTLKEIEKKI